ncbi:MAG: hypothetical protein IJI25_08955 [Eubacterium sp.]|nr:hypothetical protein [Eubacterium sp.]
MPIGNIRKFFKIITREGWGNEESIRLYFDYIPEIEADFKEQWNIASRDFQEGYQDPRYKDGDYIIDKRERDRRKYHNAKLMSKVKFAKSRYNKFLKKIPKLEVIKEETYV